VQDHKNISFVQQQLPGPITLLVSKKLSKSLPADRFGEKIPCFLYL
jgi:hypothetical protein